MLVDTDFLLALLKPSDWLKEPAQRARDEHVGGLRTTEASLVELFFLGERHGLDPMRMVSYVMGVAPFDQPNVAFLAARNRKRGLGAVDAILAAHAEDRGEPLLSSDRAFDGLRGVVRVPLEPPSQGD